MEIYPRSCREITRHSSTLLPTTQATRPLPMLDHTLVYLVTPTSPQDSLRLLRTVAAAQCWRLSPELVVLFHNLLLKPPQLHRGNTTDISIKREHDMQAVTVHHTPQCSAQALQNVHFVLPRGNRFMNTGARATQTASYTWLTMSVVQQNTE